MHGRREEGGVALVGLWSARVVVVRGSRLASRLTTYEGSRLDDGEMLYMTSLVLVTPNGGEGGLSSAALLEGRSSCCLLLLAVDE